MRSSGRMVDAAERPTGTRQARHRGQQPPRNSPEAWGLRTCLLAGTVAVRPRSPNAAYPVNCPGSRKRSWEYPGPAIRPSNRPSAHHPVSASPAVSLAKHPRDFWLSKRVQLQSKCTVPDAGAKKKSWRKSFALGGTFLVQTWWLSRATPGCHAYARVHVFSAPPPWNQSSRRPLKGRHAYEDVGVAPGLVIAVPTAMVFSGIACPRPRSPDVPHARHPRAQPHAS